MCGVAGILGFAAHGEPTRGVLEALGRAIAHRGPDEHGTWLDGCIGLTARRLRVVDLITGQQPLANEDGSLRLVANGEIYNADELRDDLSRRGHVFASRTDTEVILHAYEEEGSACLRHLEGMFAFAIWDANLRQLFLARDRFGEKPLYYARLPHAFVFASELKALLHHPGVSRELDWRGLSRYLTYEYIPSPHTIFQTIRKLPAAHWMTVGCNGSERVERYWLPPSPRESGLLRGDAAEQVLSLLRVAVNRRTSCDVPWGTLLSGGLDSSLVTALAVESSRRPVKTFAIGFEEPTYDERAHAANVARLLGTQHHDVVLQGAEVPGLLPEIAQIFDEPFADPTIVPAVVLARLARKHVTVVLSGDGGDELFCGYPTQTAHLAAELYRRLPGTLRRAICAASEALPTSHRYLSFDFVLRRFLRDALRGAADRHVRWMGSFAPEDLAGLLSSEARDRVARDDPYADIHETLAIMAPKSPSDVATVLDLAFYLADDNLVQSDRSSMASALEVRAPFLDRRLAEYALEIPANLRRGLWKTKPLLRRAGRRVLPHRVRRRAKHGFGVPSGAWLRGDLRELASDTLSPDRLRQQGIFDSAYVQALWQRHLSGERNHRKQLWTVLMFQLWASAFLGA